MPESIFVLNKECQSSLPIRAKYKLELMIKDLKLCKVAPLSCLPVHSIFNTFLSMSFHVVGPRYLLFYIFLR